MKLKQKSKKSKNVKSRSFILLSNIKIMRKPIFLTSGTRKTFNYLKKAFIKVPIFQYFNLKYYILIKTTALSYTIDRVLT